jgi:hypothetical protein
VELFLQAIEVAFHARQIWLGKQVLTDLVGQRPNRM